MPKNANKMGTIRKRSDGRWEARYTAPDGRQRSIYAKTQKAATEALRTALREVDTGEWLQPSRMTMDEWLTTWLRDYQAHTTGRTVETYRSVINKHMRPIFGDVCLCDFTAVHVRRMVADMGKLSPSTVRHALAILGAAMGSAVDDGLIKSNPVETVKAPRPVKHPFTVIDRTQIKAFVAAIQKTSVADALLFMLLTGVRAGEMRGLKWSDVDLAGATVRIERQLYAPNAKRAELRPPKDGEARTLHVAAEVVDLLRAHRKAQAADRLHAGADWKETPITADLVFRMPRGTYIVPSTLNYAINQVRDDLGLPDLRPHDLRHSYAVAALRSGIDVKTVQHNLGHKSAAITLDIYAAYTDDAGKTAAEKLSAYFADAIK